MCERDSQYVCAVCCVCVCVCDILSDQYGVCERVWDSEYICVKRSVSVSVIKKESVYVSDVVFMCDCKTIGGEVCEMCVREIVNMCVCVSTRV